MRLERLNIKLYIFALSWAFWSNKAGNAPPPPHHLLASADGDGSGVLSGMMLGDESSATGSRGRQRPPPALGSEWLSGSPLSDSALSSSAAAAALRSEP